MKILGIESSHDDTSIALINDFSVSIYLKISQIEIHKKYGGTIPEIASREHFQNFYVLLEELKNKMDLNEIDAIAYTEKPGLIGALQMGKLFAHSLSKILDKPLFAVDHLEGHICSVFLDNNQIIHYPSIALVISGGHTNLYLLKDKQNWQLIGQTLDDAAGEVFDKVSRVLFNEFPGGPKIDQVYNQYKNQLLNQYKLNEPKLENKYDFSFSGYKTQIINKVNTNSNIDKNILAACFEKNVVDFIIKKVRLAIEEFKPNSIVLSGGVSANTYLREEFSKLHTNVLIPNLKYTTDNGAMIAAAAFYKLKNN